MLTKITKVAVRARPQVSQTARFSGGHSIDDLQKGFKGYYVQKNLMAINPRLKPVSSMKGRTVFVSGGSRGIGLAIAKKAASSGANVLQVDARIHAIDQRRINGS